MQNLGERAGFGDAVIYSFSDQPLVEKGLIKQPLRRYGETGTTIIASSYSESSSYPPFSGRSFRDLLTPGADDIGATSNYLSKRECVG